MSRSQSVLTTLGRRLRLGLIGGSYGFIGPVHRTAARMDDCFELVAGSFSSNPDRSRAFGQTLGIEPERCYDDVHAMVRAEALRQDGIDAVVVMTPNAHHFEACMAALGAGLHVICDKPVTATIGDAQTLAQTVADSGLVFCLTHNYTGFPMVRQAREMVSAGAIGEIRQVHLTYVQGYFSQHVEAGQDQPGWRFDPAQGASLVLGDIGTHAHHLGAFVSGLQLDSVMADVGATVPGRQADDYAGLLMRWSNGARGTLWVTNAAAGSEHGLAFRIYGSEGGLEWHQEVPNELRHRQRDGYEVVMTKRLHGALSPHAEATVRVEMGHPEGYQEAFATLYREAAEAIVAHKQGRDIRSQRWDFPTVIDGVRGLQFIDAAVRSTRQGTWVTVER
jgi:predicted dehydrogenase